MRSITVTPADSGWAVRSDAIDNHLVFRSGAKAEEAAKRLGQALADSGELVQIDVHLRDGERAGRFVCVPQPLTAAAEPSATAGQFEAV